MAGDIDPEVTDGLGVDGLLLGLHDVGQAGVARLIQPQVGGDHRRQGQLQGLQSAVDLAGHHGLAAGDLDLGGEGGLGPVEQGGQHLAHGVVVPVDRLLAHEHQFRLFLVHHRLEQLGHLQGGDVGVGLDQQAAVGAHGQGRADGLLGLHRADGDGDHLGGDPLFLQPDGLFHGDLAEGVHGHLHIGEVHAGLVGLHPSLDVGVDHPFHRDQNLHRWSASFKNLSTARPVWRRDCEKRGKLTMQPRPVNETERFVGVAVKGKGRGGGACSIAGPNRDGWFCPAPAYIYIYIYIYIYPFVGGGGGW